MVASRRTTIADLERFSFALIPYFVDPSAWPLSLMGVGGVIRQLVVFGRSATCGIQLDGRLLWIEVRFDVMDRIGH